MTSVPRYSRHVFVARTITFTGAGLFAVAGIASLAIHQPGRALICFIFVLILPVIGLMGGNSPPSHHPEMEQDGKPPPQ